MLKTTLVEMRLGLVIGLGEMGAQVVENLRGLLDRRLGPVPIIGLITLTTDSDSEQLEQTLEHGVCHFRLSFDPAHVPSSDEDGADGIDPIHLRRTGRLTLKPHAMRLQGLLDDIQGEIRTQDKLTRIRNRQDRTFRVDETGLDVFIVAALDDPFASGAFLDLAYLIENSLHEIRSEKFDYYTNGILFLPNYTRDGNQGMREADTYAALKELDYYTSRRHYEADYGPRFRFTSKTPPFNHSCYLVEAANEKERGLPEQAQLTAMVDEWLFRYLTSPLTRYLPVRGSDLAWRTAAGRVTAYSGLGIASFILPIDEAIEECAIRLGEEMVGYFRRELTGDAKSEPKRQAQAFRGGLVSQTIDQAILRVEQSQDFQNLQNIPSAHFDNIDLWDFETLRQRIKGLFGHRLNQALPSLRREMVKQAEAGLAHARSMIAEKVEQIINESPIAGVDRAYLFLEGLQREIADQARQAQQAAKEEHDREKLGDRQIVQSRAEHRSATETVDNWPSRILLTASLAVILAFLVYTEIILIRRLPGLSLSVLGRQLLDLNNTMLWLAAGVLLLGHLVILGVVAFYTFDWMKTSKHNYLASHRDRLGHSLAKARHDLRRRFFQALEDVVQEQLGAMTDFRDLLDDLSAELAALRTSSRPLYGKPRFLLEESVLTPRDLDEFYQEMSKVHQKKGLDDLIARLIQEQEAQGRRFYDWRRLEPETLRDIIVAFGKVQMEPLRRWKSAEWLLIEHLDTPAPDVERLDALVELAAVKLASAEGEESLLPALPELTDDQREALRRRMDELMTQACPFLRYNSVELPVDVTPHLIELLGVATAEADQTPLNRTVKQHFPSVSLVQTRDPHTIVAMTVRHGLPLYALGMARRYRTRYQRFFNDKPLHTRESYQALPDLFPLTAGALEPQMAVALGLTLETEDDRGNKRAILDQDEDGEYYYVYQDKRKQIQVPLGREKIGVCILLQQRQSDHLVRISQQIDDAVRAWASRNGNQAVIQSLEEYIETSHDQLEDWEVASIEGYIGLLQ